MKAIIKKRFCLCIAFTLVAAVFLTTGAAPALAAPVVMKATTNSPNGTLYSVGLATPTPSPGPYPNDTTLTSRGTTNTEYNNMGWRSIDGLLYAIELTSSGSTGNYVTINPLTGQVASTTAIGNLPTPTTDFTNVRWDAGDVDNASDYLYIANTATVNHLYTLDLSTGSLLSNTATTISGVNYVADWAFRDGFLYGMDIDGDFVKLDPSDGSTTSWRIGPTSNPGVAFGAAWYDPDSDDIFVYRNASTASGATIYQVDVSGTPSVVDRYGATGSPLHDGAFEGAVVPIPGAVWLFASGLIGLVMIRRKKD